MPALIQFFSLTYVISWGCWIAAAALRRSAIGSDLPALTAALLYIGTFAPALVALSMTALIDESGRVTALLNRMFEWRVGLRWYAFALSYMAAIKLIAALLYRVAVGAWPPFGNEPWYVILAMIPVATPGQAGEEIGWRGYALPRLAAHLGFARASLILGLLVACWHLPLFFMPGVRNAGQSFPLFAVYVVGLSVTVAWLYAKTDGSLLLAMLIHSAVNQTIGIVPTRLAVPGNPFALDTSLVTLLAGTLFVLSVAYFLVQLRYVEPIRSDGQAGAYAAIKRRVS